MFKKVLSMIVCLVMLMALIPSAGATAMTVTVGSSSSGLEGVQAAAVLGDTIYYVDYLNNLYSRKPSEPEAIALGSLKEAKDGNVLSVEQMLSWNGKVYGVSFTDKTLYLLVDETGAFTPAAQEVTLDLSQLVEEENGDVTAVPSMTSAFCVNDYFYYTAMNVSGTGMSTVAGRINLNTGASQSFATKNIHSLAPGEDGKLTAYIFDISALYSATTTEGLASQVGELAVFDPETDTLGASYPVEAEGSFGGLVVGGLCYGNQTAYYINGSKIMGVNMATGESRISAYTGEGMFGGANSGAAAFVDGYYMNFSYSGMNLYKLDSENLKKGALRIYGEMGSDAHKSFTRNYPDIPVEVGSDYTASLEAITQAMVSDTNPYDVLILSLNYMPVDRLLSKGYCADLSGEQGLWDIVNQMYPEFAQVLQKDGKLYGVPVDATAYTYGVNKELWEELGLSEDDLPTSMTGLLDFAANWVYDYGEDHPDIYLFNSTQSSQMLFSLMLQNYMAYTQRMGENMLFNTPTYRALLKAFEAVDFEEIDNLVDQDSMYVSSDKALFSLYNVVMPPNNSDSNVTPLYLSLTDDDEPFLSASMSVMIINPKTTRMDSALLYMKNYLNNLPQEGAGMTMFPDHNDPVEMKDYQQTLDELDQMITSAQTRLESAAAENKAEIQSEIDSLKDSVEEVEKNRYTLTAEMIQNYHESVYPIVYVQRQNILYSASDSALTEINTLMMQYLAKAIDADKMVQELDNRLRLMAMEDD
ncbi:MAG: hypothetical protein PHI98_11460 [Eubacteriales bacterium]|nr:hypothetical protein [Eubacteriales bacterium]